MLKNDSSRLADWKGDVGDVQAALQKIGMDNHVLIIDANLLLYPTFNMQRVVEHCYTRGRNTIAFSTMTETDHRLFGMDPQDVITLSADYPVPPIATFKLDQDASKCSSQMSDNRNDDLLCTRCWGQLCKLAVRVGALKKLFQPALSERCTLQHVRLSAD